MFALILAGHAVVFAGTRPLQAFLAESAAPGHALHLDVWEVDRGKTIRAYDVSMTKRLHMIAVSGDLSDFQHIHPVLHANGHFTIDLHPATRQLYHVYIDGIPRDIGREVFRFDVPIDSDVAAPARRLNGEGNSKRAGPYTVTLDSVSVPYGEIATIAVTISKNGRTATDLHPYLGAVAHGVFVGVRDLAYMHAHGMSDAMLAMASNDCGDSMMQSMPPLAPQAAVNGEFSFELLAPSAQPYDFWLQFIGGKTLYTVPFLVTTH